ncbi:Uncharacterised protein [Klebsiella pneumoniae]|nr:Uncharacterised protein [Klebsiella pneumoniae]
MNIPHFQKHATTALIVNFTRLRQTNAAGTAVEQLDLKLIFQFGHRLADRGDAHLKLACSGGKGAKFNHFGED